jgi:UDPglucose 6-dehydrogenase
MGIADADTKPTLAELVVPFAGDRVLWVSVESAEMTKHAINSFLAVSVTFANEIARLCETVGADASEVEQGLRSESRIGPKAYIRPGSAFSGGTLARDVVALTHLARDNGEPAELLSAILASNERHKNWAIRRLELICDTLKGIEIAVLGLTYKPGTDTLRRSSAVETCAELLAQGAHVRCYDPVVNSLPPQLCAARLCNNLSEAVRDVDAVIVATEWPEIKLADWKSLLPTMKQPPLILDANGFLNLAGEEASRVHYFAVGRLIA